MIKCASVLYKTLHYLFCLTLKYGYLPSEWELHKIIPIFKSGDRPLVKNYHPISLLSYISKVLERIIYDKTVGQNNWRNAVRAHCFGCVKIDQNFIDIFFSNCNVRSQCRVIVTKDCIGKIGAKAAVENAGFLTITSHSERIMIIIILWMGWKQIL